VRALSITDIVTMSSNNGFKRTRNPNNSKVYNPIIFDKRKPEQTIVTTVMRRHGGTLEKNATNRQRSVVNDTFDSYDKEVHHTLYS